MIDELGRIPLIELIGYSAESLTIIVQGLYSPGKRCINSLPPKNVAQRHRNEGIAGSRKGQRRVLSPRPMT